MNIDEAATRLQAICAQWGMPWAEMKHDGVTGFPPGRCIVRMAIMAEFLREMLPYLAAKGQTLRFNSLRVEMVATLLGITQHSVYRHLRELRRWLPVSNRVPVTARAIPTVRMTGPDRASLEEQVQGGYTQ